MSLLGLAKLEKLRIHIYKATERGPTIGVLNVMFNPDSFQMTHGNQYSRLWGISTAGRQSPWSHSSTNQLGLDLLFDGTGVGDLGVQNLFGAGAKSVAEQIRQFRELCLEPRTDTDEPAYLTLDWGAGPIHDFRCRLQSATIRYTAFDMDGSPLRAKIQATFLEDAPKKPPECPDLSHSRVVRAGDTLPLLAREIYGSSEHYLWLAAHNGLDQFRELVPGETIHFPPRES